MSVETSDLKSQLQHLQDKAQELGHILILEADELIHQQTLSHHELLQRMRGYEKLKQQTFALLLDISKEYGALHLHELETVQFYHLEQLMGEIQQRREHLVFMEEKLLTRIHALPRNERESLLLVYTGCLQDIREFTLWDHSPVLSSIQLHEHDIWQQLRSAEIIQEQREQELEAVARERLSHVTVMDVDSTLDLLSDKHYVNPHINDKPLSNKGSANPTFETDLIFDDTFEIGKNMSLLKGRDLFPPTPGKKTAINALSSTTPQNPDHASSIYELDQIQTSKKETSTSRMENVEDSKHVASSPGFIIRSQQQVPAIGSKNKSPLQKLRLDHHKVTLLADLVLQNRGLMREHRKIDLIWELIRQRRFGLASIIAERCDEQENAPPAWLLRVLALTSSLYFPQGEVSRSIEQELYHFKPQIWAASHQEDQQALGYLLRAAVLRLSLINPGKISSSILKSFSIKDGEVQLYNFCSRLVYFGQLSPRIGAHLLSTSLIKPVAQDYQGRTVIEDITLWIKQVRDKTLHYQEAALIYTTPNWSLFRSANQRHKFELWSFIAATFFFNSIYKMLQMIRNSERGATSRVRQELKRIREGLNLPQQIGLKIPREYQLHQLLPANIHELIQQGLTIADRWLVTEIPATANPFVASQDVNQLQEEVHKRYSLLMQELAQLRFESQSESRVLSIDCLMEAFQDLRQLVDQQYEMPHQEVNPDHVINQEILRSGLSEFDERWKPRATPQEQELAILDMLVHPEQTWVVAMKRIAGRGAWPMLHELREIPNMLTSQEQAELEEYLKYVDIPEYRQVMLQLAELQQEMKQAEYLKLITTEEYQACNWRLVQISELNPAYWELNELKQEVEYLKKFLEKKRQEEQAKIKARFAELNQRISLPSGYPGKPLSPGGTISLQSESIQNSSSKHAPDNNWIIDL